jgi:hypothetical protein
MAFGRSRPPARLLFARSLVYLQAGLLVIGGAFYGLLALNPGGALGTDESLNGLFTHAAISGGGLLGLAAIQIGIAALLVYLTREADGNPSAFRAMLTWAQAGCAVYWVGFINDAAGAWVAGPLLAASIVSLHWWPEISTRLLGPDRVTAAPAGSATSLPGDAAAPPPGADPGASLPGPSAS